MTALTDVEGLQGIGSNEYLSTYKHVLTVAAEFINASSDVYTAQEKRAFNECFGCVEDVCVALWMLLVANKTDDDTFECRHMMWALMYLKQYPTKSNLARQVGSCRNTTRKWVYYMVERIAALDSLVVSYYR